MKKIFLFFTAALFPVFSVLYAQTIRYVKPSASGAGNGSSWANASGDLQAMMNASAINDQIWVAAGTYTPTRDIHGNLNPSDPRDASFLLRYGVKVFGGFNGTETGFAARNPIANQTILSGDLTGNDIISGNGSTTTITYNGENAYHVLVFEGMQGAGWPDYAELNGFTVRGGNANGSGFLYFGNYIDNRYFHRDSGGGIYAVGGPIRLEGNNFLYNQTSGSGGAVFASNSTPGRRSVFARNKLMYNTAGGIGGAMAVVRSASLSVDNVLAFNTAVTDGNGGGIGLAESGETAFINNTVVFNNGSGLSMVSEGPGTISIQNTLFWGNKLGGSDNVSGADINSTDPLSMQLWIADYCLLQANSMASSGLGLITGQAPAFADAAAGNVKLLTGSQGIDQANNSLTDASTFDIDNEPRAQGGAALDIGAYELNVVCGNVPTRVLVDGSLPTGDNSGSSWANAVKNLSSALKKAYDCKKVEEVWVKTGTYKPSDKPFFSNGLNSNGTSREHTFFVRAGLKFYGGFAGTEASIAERNIAAHPTVLSGDFNNDDVISGAGGTLAISGNGENAYHVVVASRLSEYGMGVTIDGFTIRNGNANRGEQEPHLFFFNTQYGVGLPQSAGGGIYGHSVFVVAENCTFLYNRTRSDGGAVYVHFPIGGNLFRNNSLVMNQGNRGGAIHWNGGNSTLQNNLFLHNQAWKSGGGISIADVTDNQLVSNTFYNNASLGNDGGDGGAIFLEGGTHALENNLFWANQKAGSPTVPGADIQKNSPAVVTLAHCLTQENSLYPSGTGILNNQDPQFSDLTNLAGADAAYGTADDGLRLKVASPARNAGRNAITAAYMRDLPGNTRIFDQTIDIGAYEFCELAGLTTATGANQNATADGQYTDVTGWTHFLNDAAGQYILSVKKQGSSMGNVGDPGFAATSNTAPNWSATTAASITAPYTSNPDWKVMNRWWNVTTATEPDGDVQVRMYYTAEDLAGLRVATGDASLTHTQLTFFKINGSYDPNPALGHAGIPAAAAYNQPGYWEYTHGPAATTSTWRLDSLGTGGPYFAEYVVASFSGGGGGASPGGGGSAGTFPVEWLAFEATPAGNAITLDWTTASEQNNAFFTAERSLNGVDFEPISIISSIGNSSSPTTYSYTDHQLPDAATLHYRIRQTDIDGQTSHSSIRTVAMDRTTGLMAWPNPVPHHLTVHVPAQVYAITLADASGRTVHRLACDGQATNLIIDLSNFPAGIYTLQAGTVAMKVVKE